MVNIYEQAIKPVVDLEDGVTVYVPGYSTIGPEEPTLCSSESEFEGLFGSSPYLFEADQEYSLISQGSPEKGYLYAKSLLALFTILGKEVNIVAPDHSKADNFFKFLQKYSKE